MKKPGPRLDLVAKIRTQIQKDPEAFASKARLECVVERMIKLLDVAGGVVESSNAAITRGDRP